MGLTLHYELHSRVRTAARAKRLVEQLREAACDLPFDEVGPLATWQAAAGEREEFPGGMWQATQFTRHGESWRELYPTRLFAFRVEPAAGSESAEFGLARYPRRAGWSWKSFCKTQYASSAEHGGLANFLRCHVGLVKLLDAGASLGLHVKVHDEGEFWERRDVQALASEIGRWNELIAGFGGHLKDALGHGRVESPIFQFPDFEHLEANDAARRKRRE
jgi:hypothetical protein